MDPRGSSLAVRCTIFVQHQSKVIIQTLLLLSERPPNGKVVCLIATVIKTGLIIYMHSKNPYVFNYGVK